MNGLTVRSSKIDMTAKPKFTPLGITLVTRQYIKCRELEFKKRSVIKPFLKYCPECEHKITNIEYKYCERCGAEIE